MSASWRHWDREHGQLEYSFAGRPLEILRFELGMDNPDPIKLNMGWIKNLLEPSRLRIAVWTRSRMDIGLAGQLSIRIPNIARFRMSGWDGHATLTASRIERDVLSFIMRLEFVAEVQRQMDVELNF